MPKDTTQGCTTTIIDAAKKLIPYFTPTKCDNIPRFTGFIGAVVALPAATAFVPHLLL